MSKANPDPNEAAEADPGDERGGRVREKLPGDCTKLLDAAQTDPRRSVRADRRRDALEAAFAKDRMRDWRRLRKAMLKAISPAFRSATSTALTAPAGERRQRQAFAVRSTHCHRQGRMRAVS